LLLQHPDSLVFVCNSCVNWPHVIAGWTTGCMLLLLHCLLLLLLLLHVLLSLPGPHFMGQMFNHLGPQYAGGAQG
jgi:hypothetical protein